MRINENIFSSSFVQDCRYKLTIFSRCYDDTVLKTTMLCTFFAAFNTSANIITSSPTLQPTTTLVLKKGKLRSTALNNLRKQGTGATRREFGSLDNHFIFLGVFGDNRYDSEAMLRQSPFFLSVEELVNGD